MTTVDDENVLDVLLMSLGDELDGTLQALLEPIGKAIADSIAGSRVRIEEFEKRYGREACGLEAAYMLAEEEQAVVEHLLGLAFVAAQTAYITAVVSRLTDVHRLARVRNSTELTTTSGSKPDMLRYRFRPAPKKPYSQIEIVDAFANYYKHRDEWGPDWSTLKGQQRQTADIISSAGAHQSSTKNLRTAAEHLGNPTHGNVCALAEVLSPWRRNLVQDYRAEIRSKNLR